MMELVFPMAVRPLHGKRMSVCMEFLKMGALSQPMFYAMKRCCKHYSGVLTSSKV